MPHFFGDSQMKLRRWNLMIAAVVFLFSGAAMGVDANRLCIHNGADYYVIGHDHSAINCGGGKYFPSFTHIPATQMGGQRYPWKIKGWAWIGMQAGVYGDRWNWSSVLQKSKDNPYSSMMTWPYPALYTQGMTHSGSPPGLYNLVVPSTVTQLPGIPSNFTAVGLGMIAPCSANGFDQYMNIIAGCELSMVIPSTAPYYSMEFAFILSGTTLLLESSHSVWQYVWENTGPIGQYLGVTQSNPDCTGTLGGNKGRNYSLIGGVSSPTGGYWANNCTGGNVEWAMGLFVEDAVCIPTNVSPNPTGPFATYGFDVGSGTVTPFVTSGVHSVQGMFESYAYSGHTYQMLACLASSPAVPYGPLRYRIPGWDAITDLFVNTPIWQATVAPGYPGGMYGSTVGGHTGVVPSGPQPSLYGAELTFFGFDIGGGPPTAGFTVTYF